MLLRFCCRHSLVNITRLSLTSPDSKNPSFIVYHNAPPECSQANNVHLCLLYNTSGLIHSHNGSWGFIHTIKHTRYLRGQSPVLKLGNLSLAWEFAQSPSDHNHFVNMLGVSPKVFDTLLCLNINDHLIFYNNPQTNIQMKIIVFRG